jgi:uncharacterized protein YgiM (DUF1202 family)
MEFNFFELFKILLVCAVVIILVFLALREFWCWYFKINKRIILLEEQNRLLSSLNKYLVPIVKSSYNDTEIKRTIADGDNKQYIITQEIKLFEKSDKNSGVVCRLLKGETITFLDKQEVNTVVWYKVKDKENNVGWCLLAPSE